MTDPVAIENGDGSVTCDHAGAWCVLLAWSILGDPDATRLVRLASSRLSGPKRARTLKLLKQKRAAKATADRIVGDLMRVMALGEIERRW